MQNQPDPEREIRLRPPRPRRPRAEVQVWASAFRRIQIMLRAGRRASKRLSAAARRSSYVTPPHIQRCSVRITYSKNKGPGQWKAHGRYLERESATGGEKEKRIRPGSRRARPGRHRQFLAAGRRRAAFQDYCFA